MFRHHLARAAAAAGLSFSITVLSLFAGIGASATWAVGPSTQGAEPTECYVLVAGEDKVFGTTAHVVPREVAELWGPNWVAGGSTTLTIKKVGTSGQQTRSVAIGPTGEFQSIFTIPASGGGTWQFTVTQSAPACNVTARAIVLPLTDILNSKFLGDIKWLYVEGVTSGCTATTFCPNGLVTRGQMATFIARALNLPASPVDYFTDDETNKHEGNINRLRHADITFGCGGTRFCPDGVVTRGQMASFLVRAFDLPSTTNNYFTDDNGTTHEANINRLRASGITSGCGGTNFCPNGQVTRGQMAAFLHRAME